ncbi:MAG: 2-C-methyl-D-erythritol 4-phosphate cytidylyltransferase [Lachnospiraceae bacterium]|nr:2-C-methyl-D-erythritol 4-phosphate cytidylyltransferase [Lachnospiraceae bacterium]
MEKITAIILAAGNGSRMKSKTKKQYMEINGKPVIAHTLTAFELSEVDSIILVTGKDEIDSCKEIVEKEKITKVEAIVSGGKERSDSVYEGLKTCTDSDYVLIHDGARPIVTKELIGTCIEKMKEYKACVVGVPVTDTIKIADENENIKSTPDRSTLWSIQTPQCFEYSLVKGAFDKMYNEGGVKVTDDAMVVEKYQDKKVKIIMGDYRNIKITTPSDIQIAAVFLNEI